MTSKALSRNAVKCRLCDDIIESKHRHDFVSCSCGSVFVDGGSEYQRIGWDDKDGNYTFDEVVDASYGNEVC